jgi:hypothetical protein
MAVVVLDMKLPARGGHPDPLTFRSRAVITSELLASNAVACGRIDHSRIRGSPPPGGLKPSFSVFSVSFPFPFFVLTNFFFLFFFHLYVILVYDDSTYSAVVVWLSPCTRLAFTLVFVNSYTRLFVFHGFISFEPFAHSVSICAAVFYIRICLIPVTPSHFSHF